MFLSDSDLQNEPNNDSSMHDLDLQANDGCPHPQPSPVRVSVERDWIKVGYPFPSNPVMLAVSCFFFYPTTAAAGEFVLVERCSHSETQNVDVSGFSRHKPRVSHCIIPSKITAMRRKSRILLCFAVLWVLGIAYYFYSGTTLSRKVGFSFRCFLRVSCCWIGANISCLG